VARAPRQLTMEIVRPASLLNSKGISTANQAYCGCVSSCTSSLVWIGAVVSRSMADSVSTSGPADATVPVRHELATSPKTTSQTLDTWPLRFTPVFFMTTPPRPL
jgi:hypothetical protein